MSDANPAVRIKPVAVSLALLAIVLALALSSSFYARLSADPFFSLTLAGFAIVFLSVSAQSWLDWARLSLLAVCLIDVQVRVLNVPLQLAPALAMLGAAGFLLLAIRRVRSQGEPARFLYYTLLPPFLLVVTSYWGSTLLGVTASLHPKTFDQSLYNFDQSLGVQLSCVAGRIVLRSHALKWIAVGLYYALPLAGMFVYSRQLLRQRSFAMTAFLAFLVAGPVGVLFYNLLPACGPIYLLGSRFPFDPPSLLQLAQLPLATAVLAGPRNAFPSLHMAWALLAWWYSGGLSWRERLPVLAFLIGTAVAILALGEHYFIDLIAAFPFALMIEAACALQLPFVDRRRFLPLLAGLTLLMAWVALLRSNLEPGWMNPVAAWLLVAITVVPALFLHARLRAAVLRGSGLDTQKASGTDS